MLVAMCKKEGEIATRRRLAWPRWLLRAPGTPTALHTWDRSPPGWRCGSVATSAGCSACERRAHSCHAPAGSPHSPPHRRRRSRRTAPTGTPCKGLLEGRMSTPHCWLAAAACAGGTAGTGPPQRRLSAPSAAPLRPPPPTAHALVRQGLSLRRGWHGGYPVLDAHRGCLGQCELGAVVAGSGCGGLRPAAPPQQLQSAALQQRHDCAAPAPSVGAPAAAEPGRRRQVHRPVGLPAVCPRRQRWRHCGGAAQLHCGQWHVHGGCGAGPAVRQGTLPTAATPKQTGQRVGSLGSAGGEYGSGRGTGRAACWASRGP